MKRILAILLAGLMLLSLTACGRKEENVIKVGSLELEGMNDLRTDAHNAHRREERNVADGTGFEREQGYLYPHNYPGHWVKQQYLPDDIKNKKYYIFGENKTESAAKAYSDMIKK